MGCCPSKKRKCVPKANMVYQVDDRGNVEQQSEEALSQQRPLIVPAQIQTDFLKIQVPRLKLPSVQRTQTTPEMIERTEQRKLKFQKMRSKGSRQLLESGNSSNDLTNTQSLQKIRTKPRNLTVINRSQKKIGRRMPMPVLTFLNPGNQVFNKKKKELKLIGQYKIQQKVRKDAQCSQYKAVDKHRKSFNIKVYKKSLILSSAKRREIDNEIKIQQSLQHDKVLKIVQVVQNQGKVCLVTQSFIENVQNHGRFSLEESKKLFQDLVQGLEYIHCCEVAHCGLDPVNLVLTPSLKISGFSRSENSIQNQIQDIQALGPLLYYLLQGKFPNTPDQFPTHFSEGLKSFFKLLYQAKNLDQIKLHPWFKN